MVQHLRYEPHAILVADMVGYSRLLAEQPISTHTAFSAHLLGVFHPCVRTCAGRIVKTTGDGFVAIFERASDAEACARAIQAKMESESAVASEIRYRISAHYGNIIVEPSDVFGIDVNAAIHMQALAPTGGICISGNLFLQLRDIEKATYKYMGRKYLKNIPDAIDIYHYTGMSAHTGPGPPAIPRGFRRRSLSPTPRIGVGCLRLHTPTELGKLLTNIAQDALIYGLSRFRDVVAVIPLDTALTLPGAGQTDLSHRLSNELGLDYLLFGSCKISDGEVIYTVHLEHLIAREVLWSNKISLSIDLLDRIDEQLARQLVTAIVLYVQRNEIETSFLGAHVQYSENETLFREAKKLIAQGSLGAVDRAREFLSTIVGSEGDVADVHIAFARAEHLHGRLLAGQQFVEALERARGHAKKAIEIDELNAQAHAELALQELFLKRHSSAAEIYQRALSLNPYDPMLQADWADCLTFLGKADEAQQILTKVAEGWPSDRSAVLWNLCDAEWALNRPERIVEILQNQPDLPYVHRNLTAAYAKLGRVPEARHHAEKVREHQPGFSAKEWSKVVPHMKSDTAEEFTDHLAKAGL
jgi:adenylate cyclase